MCGILGANFPAAGSAEAALSLLRHRGPDHQAIKEHGSAILGHTRLAIIDLDAEADQPMEFDGLIIVFNGEIYNYETLRSAESLPCLTKSDTEVILRLYQKYGKRCVEKLEGMFAFCIYDTRSGEYFCARDRFGKKPFFYYAEPGRFLFASEIKAILAWLERTPPLNTRALHEYLTFWAPIGENSFYEGIKKLRPGHTLSFDGARLGTECYYTLDAQGSPHSDEKTVLCDIASLLEKAVAKRLVADVEVASLLSGGLDSSFISALYAKTSGKTINTFSIGYDEHRHYCELEYARSAARHIGSNHHEFIMTRHDFIATIDRMLEQTDEPLGDSAAIPTYLLSQHIHQQGIKVALSGEGSDEIFLGYEHYFELLRSGKNEFLMTNAAFSEEEKSALLQHYLPTPYAALLRDQNLSLEKQFTLNDLSLWVGDVLMSKLDRMSMAHSLELRAPFLDHRLVEYLLGVDDRIKKGDTGKYLLKKIATAYLPEEIVSRKKKGFSSPFIEWLYAEYGSEILHTIRRVNAQLGIFNETYVLFLYNEAKEKRYKQHLWNLFIFCRWYEKVYM